MIVTFNRRDKLCNSHKSLYRNLIIWGKEREVEKEGRKGVRRKEGVYYMKIKHSGEGLENVNKMLVSIS